MGLGAIVFVIVSCVTPLSVDATEVALFWANIVLILCVDLSYANVGFNGAEDIATPTVDALTSMAVSADKAQQPAAAVQADTRPAAVGKTGTAKPLISEPGDLPKLRDFIGFSKTTATGALVKKANPKPSKRPNKT